MKRISLLLVAMCFMYGCGSGGGGITASNPGGGSSNPTPTTTVSSAPLTTFTIKLQNQQTTGKSVAYLNLSSVSGKTADYARVAVRQINSVTTTTTTYPTIFDDVTETFVTDLTHPITTTSTKDTETYRRVVSDILIDSNNQIKFTTPMSMNSTDRYFFDVVTYKKGTAATPNVMLKVASANKINTPLGVLVNGTSSLGLALNDIAVTFTGAPSKITSESFFTVPVQSSFPLNANFDYAVQTVKNIPLAPATFAFSTAAKNYPFSGSYQMAMTAPSVGSADAADNNLRFDARFHLDSSMLDLTNNNDSINNFIWFMPSLNIPFAPLVQQQS